MSHTLFKAYVAAELLYNDRNFAGSHEMNQSGKFSPCCIELHVVHHGSHVLTSVLKCFWNCELVD
jgi:hypothetical protein